MRAKQYQDPPSCPPGAGKTMAQRGPLLQVNQMPRLPLGSVSLPWGIFFCKNLEKSIFLFFKRGLSHPSWPLDQVTGEGGGEATSQSPGVGDNKQGWPTCSLDAHCLHVREFTPHQKLLSGVSGEFQSSAPSSDLSTHSALPLSVEMKSCFLSG